MAKYRVERKRLARGHGWRAQPNHNVLVLGRGAVQLEFPRDWVLDAEDDCVKVRDRKEPDDECVLGVSYHRWPAVGAELSVATLVRDTLLGDARPFLTVSPIVEESCFDLVLAWGQGNFIDARAGREACARLCLARKWEIQALLTFDFWLADTERCDALWRSFLATLQLGERVADPQVGPSLA